jgi:hypothetical protein
LRASWPALERCYRDGLVRHPALWGRIGIELRVGESGSVTSARETESHFPDADVASCAIASFEGLHLTVRRKLALVYPVRLGQAPAATE